MEIIYSTKTNAFFAQAYGTSTYGTQEYSCVPGDVACATATETGTETGTVAPNTGFLGMSQDAAIASVGGAVLLAVALIGTAFVIISRFRASKKAPQGK
ncbi:MAG: hypothetical protein ACREGE_03845 [Candidatus Microsaccharimonas sp.]